jgi:hypothetical protein
MTLIQHHDNHDQIFKHFTDTVSPHIGDPQFSYLIDHQLHLEGSDLATSHLALPFETLLMKSLSLLPSPNIYYVRLSFWSVMNSTVWIIDQPDHCPEVPPRYAVGLPISHLLWPIVIWHPVIYRSIIWYRNFTDTISPAISRIFIILSPLIFYG